MENSGTVCLQEVRVCLKMGLGDVTSNVLAEVVFFF